MAPKDLKKGLTGFVKTELGEEGKRKEKQKVDLYYNKKQS